MHARTVAKRTSRPVPGRTWDVLVALLLIGVTVAVYAPALNGGFLWDDDTHISENAALRSWQGLWDIWFKPGATCQYYPLTFTAFWAAHAVWGLNPLGYHLATVLLHGLAAVLLWQVLKRLNVRGALLAGAIFALHPVCVMSVAWMTELKNTLSAVLILLAAWAWLRFDRLGVYAWGTRGNDRHRWRYYLLALALFQLAMFAKTAASFLPITLFLVGWWQRKRTAWRDALPLVPMLAIAVAMGWLTSYVERHPGGASGEQFELGMAERLILSGRSFWFYLGKLFFPESLTFIYERWEVDVRSGWLYLFPAATAALLGALWALRRRIGKGPFVAMVHFYVSTSFLILFLVLYMTRYSFVSDHWQYFGAMSVIAMAAAGISAGLEIAARRSPLLKPAVCGLLLVVLGVATWKQTFIYRDAEALWRDTLRKNPGCWLANLNLGSDLERAGKLDEAMRHYAAAQRTSPNYCEAYNNMGNAYLQMGDIDRAIVEYRRAIELNPAYAAPFNSLGVALGMKGRYHESVECFREALRLEPAYALAHNNLGNALWMKRDLDGAIGEYQKVLALTPGDAAAQSNLAKVLEESGRIEEAMGHYELSARLDPRNVEVQFLLGRAQAQLGLRDRSVASLKEAVRLRPDFEEARELLRALETPAGE